MYNIFLSHTADDKPFARSLTKSLNNVGIKVWIDEAEIKVGDTLIEKIREGIDSVEYVGVILSPAAVESNWVKRELDVAMNQEIENRRIKVIPILYKACELPGFLKGKLYADFTTSFTDGLRLLITRLDPGIFEKEKSIVFRQPAMCGKSIYLEHRFDGPSLLKIEGIYQVNGTNPGGQSYSGIAEIAVGLGYVTIKSSIGNKIFFCSGVIKNDELIVSGDFDVSYKILSSGQLIGSWNNGGTEILIPHTLIGRLPIKNS